MIAVNAVLIAVHYMNKTYKDIVGLRILDTDAGTVHDFNYSAVVAALASKKLQITGLELDDTRTDIKGSNGALSRYPKIVNGKITSNKVVILNEIDDLGYRVCGASGKHTDAPTNSVIEQCNKIGIANGKIVSINGKDIISSISGNYPVLPLSKSKLAKLGSSNKPLNKPVEAPKINEATISQSTQTPQSQNNSNDTKQPSVTITPVRNGPALADNNNSSINIAVSKEKIEELEKSESDVAKKIMSDANLGSAIRRARVISGKEVAVSRRNEIDPVSGMTVEQKLGYVTIALRKNSPLYATMMRCVNRVESSKELGVKTMAVSQDTMYFSSDFVIKLTLPEIIFVVMHEMSHIAMNHRGREGGREHKLWNTACDLFINKMLADEFNITEPAKPVPMIRADSGKGDGSYTIALPRVGLFSDKVDITKDTPEGIYEELKEAREKAQQQMSNNGTGSGSTSGAGQSNDSQSDDNGNNQENGNGGQESSSKQTNNGEDQNGSDNSGGVDITFRGDKVGKLNDDGLVVVSDAIADDMVDDPDSKNRSNEEKKSFGQAMQRKIATLQKMAGQDGACGRAWEIIMADIAPKLNWKKLLRNKLTEFSAKETSFMSPDKRFVHKKMHIPGYRNGQPDSLKNIKICIDCSGSIDNDDLGVALKQIKDLFREYKASGEIIFWHSSIMNIEPFKTPEEALKARPKGSGGTDPNCIYELFSTNKQYKRGGPLEPSCILIFSDGYITPLEDKYKNNKVFRDTIWIINSDNKDFKPLFGKVAPLKV